MRVVAALARLRIRQAFRAGITSGRPALYRCVRRPLILLVVLVVISVQVFNFSSAWIADHSTVAHAVVVALLFPALTALGSATTIIIFFYGFNALLLAFTDGRSFRLLLLAPIPPELAVGERIASVSLGFSGLLAVTLPALLAAGTVGLPLGYDVAVVVTILLLPLAPTSLAVLVLLPLLRWLPPARARTITTIIGTLVGLLFLFGTRALGARTGLSRSGVGLSALPDWVPTTWPGHFIAAAGLGDTPDCIRYGLLMAFVAALLFFLATTAAAQVLATGSGSYNAVPRRGSTRHAGQKEANASRATRPQWWPILAKDWRTLRRDPQRLVALLYPLAIIGFNAYGLLAGGPLQSGSARVGTTIVLLMIAGVLLVGSTVPFLVNSEGRMLALLALTPVSPGTIFRSKWVTGTLPPLVAIELALAALTHFLGLPTGSAALLAATFVPLLPALTGVTLIFSVLWPRFSGIGARRQGSTFASIATLIAEAVICAGSGAALTFDLFFSTGSRGAIAVAVMFAGLLAIDGAAFLAGPRLLDRLMRSEKVLRVES